MARIEKYAVDTAVTDNDKFIGTDSAGNVTRNYRASNIADYLNNFNKIGIAGQLSFRFIQSSVNRLPGDFFLQSGGQAQLSSVGVLIFSKSNTANKYIYDFFNYIKNEKILIIQLNDPNVFAEYQITSFSDWETDSDFIRVSILYEGGSGALNNNEYYGVARSVVNEDKTYKHTQSVSSSTWVVEHNLNKYPSVTVQDSAGSIVIGEITYNNKNTVTLTFSGAFSGEAHFN